MVTNFLVPISRKRRRKKHCKIKLLGAFWGRERESLCGFWIIIIRSCMPICLYAYISIQTPQTHCVFCKPSVGDQPNYTWETERERNKQRWIWLPIPLTKKLTNKQPFASSASTFFYFTFYLTRSEPVGAFLCQCVSFKVQYNHVFYTESQVSFFFCFW